jgi:protein gp37
MTTKPTKLEALITEVEELCNVYVGKKAEGEMWADTVARFRRILPLVRSVKREIEAIKTKTGL